MRAACFFISNSFQLIFRGNRFSKAMCPEILIQKQKSWIWLAIGTMCNYSGNFDNYIMCTERLTFVLCCSEYGEYGVLDGIKISSNSNEICIRTIAFACKQIISDSKHPINMFAKLCQGISWFNSKHIVRPFTSKPEDLRQYQDADNKTLRTQFSMINAEVKMIQGRNIYSTSAEDASSWKSI